MRRLQLDDRRNMGTQELEDRPRPEQESEGGRAHGSGREFGLDPGVTEGRELSRTDAAVLGKGCRLQWWGRGQA